MKFRLTFDNDISAALIKKIAHRAGEGSLNKALQIMVIEWSALEDTRNRPENDLIMTKNGADEQDLDTQIETASSSIDEAW